MLTKTRVSAYIELTPNKLGEILSKHFEKEINMVPTETQFVFASGCGAVRQYINHITFVAHKVETFDNSPSS